MSLCQPDLNAFRGFFAEANSAFKEREQIDPMSPAGLALNSFVLFCLDKLQQGGALDSAPDTREL